jgi:hypothetical protein
MEYATLGARDYGDAVCTDQPERELEQIKGIAKRTEYVAEQIQAFLNRYHGVGQLLSADAAKDPPACGYTGQLSRLRKAVERLENLAISL